MEGITQKELADSVGMSLRGFATILGEKSKVSQTLALAVEARFGYRADWILTGEGSQKRNFDDAHHNLGNSYRAIGNYFDAISSYKLALKINPNRNDSLHCIGLTSYDIYDYSNGKKYFKELLNKDENDHFAKRNLAIGLMKQSYIIDAIKKFEEV